LITKANVGRKNTEKIIIDNKNVTLGMVKLKVVKKSEEEHYR